MHRHLILPVLVGSVVAASTCIAAAQGTTASPGDCSGFMCKVFGSKIADRPTAAPVAAVQPVATPDVADPDDRPAAPLVHKVAKPLPTVTIAANAPEVARLKALAATLPKTHIRIVAANADGADFRLSAALGASSPAEKARLFTEALHVVAGPDIHALADLKDKVVSFGPAGGPSQDAARKAFASLGIGVKETALDLDNALDGVATGDVAAVVVLAPQPDESLRRLKAAPGLHLVSWPDSAPLPDGATSVTLSGYSNLAPSGGPIRSVGVEVALQASGHGAASPAAKAFLASLAQHSAALSKRGFDLIKADIASRGDRRVASAERR